METFFDTLKIEENICPPGCGVCREKCTQVQRSKGKNGSGIHEFHIPDLGVHMANTCNQCSEPVCLDACPSGSISKDEKDGIVRIDEKRCLGCGLCNLVCPYGGIDYRADEKKAFKCDLCDGSPECVNVCPVKGISLMKARSIVGYFHEDPLLKGSSLCVGCPAETTLRFVLRVMGKDTFLFGAPGCATNVINGQGIKCMINIPSHMSNMTTVPSTMTGVKRYYRRLGKDVKCVAFVGDGCATDVGFQPLSGAAERNENIIFMCYDNEGYMNTGIQRSSTTPYGGWTTTTPAMGRRKGKKMASKNVPLIMAAHEIPYVATAVIGYPEDFLNKLLKAMAVKDGMSYIHILSPCILGWGYSIPASLEVIKAAVETNYFPLWEYERGKYRITYEVKNPKPITEYTKLLKKFAHLEKEEIDELQEIVNRRFNRIKRLTEAF
ncbi:MAG: thiamine pyrophosphate-dependent enzyme [Syntrophorhabdaceae bacterium]|nr:thiamine pyrophosphate-dependent enzyme [Syntrophorhabdaceae bacterium]